MKGSTFKRCPCGTLTNAAGKRIACRKDHGSWCWRADAGRDPVTRKRRQESGSGYATRDEAEAALTKYKAAQRDGTWADDQRMTVEAWLSRWLDEAAQNGLEPKTLQGYKSHCRLYLVPHLGHRRLRELKRGHVEDMLRVIAASPSERPAKSRGGRTTTKRAPRTLDGIRRTLRAALSSALRRKLVSENVAEGRIDALPKIGPAETQWWEPEQVARFLELVAGERLAALYDLAAFGGLRRGELCGLRWADVDLAGGGLKVRQSLSQLSGEHVCQACGGSHFGRRFKAPKSDAGARWVPLVDETVSALLTHQAVQEFERQQWGETYSDHDLVFAQEEGSPLRPDAVSKQFDALVTAAGLPSIRLHDMRHGAASMLIAAGVPIETVAMILGHASPAVTRAVYAHVLREPARDGMRAARSLTRAGQRAQSVHTPGRSAASNPESDAMN